MQQIVEQANQLTNSIRNKLKGMESTSRKSGDRVRDTQVRIVFHQRQSHEQRKNLAKKFMDVLSEYHSAQVNFQRQQQDRMRRQYLVGAYHSIF
jgi:t-SNARE complex subunit (syntaxin)